MDIHNKKSRADLQAYFKKNSIPTEGNFRDLIGAALNQRDDGIVKPPGDPLSVEASDQTHKPVLSLYEAFADPNASWVISLAAPDGSRGFSVNHGPTASSAGGARLFIDAATGDVGIGTVDPTHTLTVAGSLAAASAEIAGALTAKSTLNVAGAVTAGSLSLGGTAATKIVTVMTAGDGDNTSLPTESAVRSYVDAAIPLGAIIMWSGDVPPAGWALCDGEFSQKLNRKRPNLLNRFVLGAGDKYQIGLEGGSEAVQLKTEQIPSHTHKGKATYKSQHLPTIRSGAGKSEGLEFFIERSLPTRPIAESFSFSHDHDLVIDPAGGGQPHENMPPYYVLAFIIRES